MGWLFVAIASALLGAIYTFLDNYSVDTFFKGRSPQAQNVFLGPVYLLVGILIFSIFEFSTADAMDVVDALVLIGAGMLASVSYIFYYSALAKEEATTVTLLEQLSPIFYLVFGVILLNETIGRGQLLGLLVILTVPFILFFSAKKQSKKNQFYTTLLMITKVAISAIANILIVKFGSPYSFVAAVSLVCIGKGAGNIATILCVKKWRRRFTEVKKRIPKLKFFGVLSIDCAVWITSDFIYYIALTMAPAVAIACATIKATQPILVFVLGIILTLIWPNFGREKINRRNVLLHLTTTIVAVCGITLMYLL